MFLVSCSAILRRLQSLETDTPTYQTNASVNSSSAHPPPGNSGAFSRTFHPGGRALAFHPITPGHLTIPHSFTLQHCRFL